MKSEKLMVIGLVSGILVPFIGDTFGYWSRAQELSKENIGWIIQWSSPIIIRYIYSIMGGF